MEKVLQIATKIFESKWSKWLILILYAGLLAWLKWTHVYERDESQILLIVNNNRNFFDLIGTLGYEGSTGLWHILLWLFSWIIPIEPASVNIIHFAFVAFFVWYFLFKIELPLIYKIAILLQLTVLRNLFCVRQYVLALIFMMVAVRAIQKDKKYLLYTMVFLLMQVHVTTIPIAISFWLYYLGVQIIRKKKINYILNLIPIMGIALCIVQLLPPSDLMVELNTWNMKISFYQLTQYFNKLISDVFTVKSTMLNIMLFPTVIAFLLTKFWKENKQQTIIWILSVSISIAAFLAISIVKYLGVNNYGVLFIAIIAFIIIIYNELNIKWNPKLFFIFIPVIMWMSYEFKVKISDYNYAPYSYADKLAEYLDENYSNKTVLTFPETHYNSIRIYRKENLSVFSLGRNDCVDYTIWNHHSVSNITNKLPLRVDSLRLYFQSVPDSLIRWKQPVVIGTEAPLFIIDENRNPIKSDIKINDSINLKLIKSFDEKTLNYITEKFLLFEIDVIN
ncbi:MAG: hypothetical protein PHE33_03720 [Bacteroidales bacterium]|nr:hypothetical protein [Bacteroidales bacterium]